MTINPRELISSLTREFKENSLVRAFVLVGSQARNNVYEATEYSDMEAYIVTKDEEIEKLEEQLPEIASKYGEVIFSFRHEVGFVAVYENLFRLELPVIKESGLEGVFNRPKAQTVKVLIDKTDGKLERILEKRPEEVDYASKFKDSVINFWHWQILGVQYFQKGEFYGARSVLGIQTSILIRLFELINDPGILLLESRKRVEEFLTNEQLGKLRQVSPAYDRQAIKDSQFEIMDIFSDTAKTIKQKYGYEYNENLEDKVKPRILELLHS